MLFLFNDTATTEIYTYLHTLSLHDALPIAMEAHGVRDAGLRQRLMDLYFNLACFPEVPAMLQSLKRAGLVTGILSNGSPAMLEAACKTAGLDGLLDHVLSVEDVGIFKPDMRIYQLVTDKLEERKGVGMGKSGSVRDDLGGRR